MAARFCPPNLNMKKMKLSKSLLSAILIGIVVQSLPACKKEKETPKTNKENKGQETPAPSEPCPGCGMG